MTSSFFISTDSDRYRGWRSYHRLTSPVLIICWLFAIMVGLAAAGLYWFGLVALSAQVVGFFLLDAAAVAGLFIPFMYATTYFPFMPVRQRPTDKKINVLEVCSFSVIGALDLSKSELNRSALEQTINKIFASNAGQNMLRRLSISDAAAWHLKSTLLTKLSWDDFAAAILQQAAAMDADMIEIEHIIAALLLLPEYKSWLRTQDLIEKDVQFVTWWLTAVRRRQLNERRWWDKGRLLAFTGLGVAWTSGYTPLVDQFSRFPRGNLWDQFVPGREDQLKSLIATLARETQSNVLLVGQPGVGRIGLVRDLAARLLAGRAHPRINGQRLIYLHIGELLAQSESGAGQLATISRALGEMERAKNIIAVLDGLGSVLGADGEQRLNLTDVLLPFFSSASMRVVVIISSDEYHLRLKDNSDLLHLFEVVQIDSADNSTTMQTLALAAPFVEERTQIELTYQTLRSLVEDTTGVLQDIPYPERAFDILEEALVIVQEGNQHVLSPNTIHELITRKTGVPVGELKDSERDRLLNLEELMHKRVVNQHQAIAAVAKAMLRARAGVRTSARPIGTFLFMGPTGVGKTETAKTLAEAYFGDSDNMIRFDMSEFQSEQGIGALIGSPDQPAGRLTSAISDHPFTVLLLDEFEKADRVVQQLFLQIFDEGMIKDVRGRSVSFRHAIIIATSNAGAELIRQRIEAGSTQAELQEDLKNYVLEHDIFRPELLNRFDGVITFTSLSREHVQQIAKLMLRKLNERLDINHGVTVAITDELIEFLLEIGYNAEFGARPMARALQDTVEYAVAQKVLRRQIQPGDLITLTPTELRQQT